MIDKQLNQLESMLFTQTDCSSLLEGLHLFESQVYKTKLDLLEALKTSLPHRFFPVLEPLLTEITPNECVQRLELIRTKVGTLPFVHMVLCYQPTTQQLIELTTTLRNKTNVPLILRYEVKENHVGTQIELNGKRYTKYLHTVKK